MNKDRIEKIREMKKAARAYELKWRQLQLRDAAGDKRAAIEAAELMFVEAAKFQDQGEFILRDAAERFAAGRTHWRGHQPGSWRGQRWD